MIPRHYPVPRLVSFVFTVKSRFENDHLFECQTPESVVFKDDGHFANGCRDPERPETVSRIVFRSKATSETIQFYCQGAIKFFFR